MTQWQCPLYLSNNTDIRSTHFALSRYSRDEIGGPHPSFHNYYKEHNLSIVLILRTTPPLTILGIIVINAVCHTGVQS